MSQTNTLPITNNQSGRSMIEMLGVLAIIGVLSVGGIAGYSKAMSKYKFTKAQDQITMLLMNIRTAYASYPNYSGLTTSSAAEFNFVPNEMVIRSGSSHVTMNHAFGGEGFVESCDSNKVDCGSYNTNKYFGIKITGLSADACRSLASSDWGADGLISMRVNNTPKSIPLNIGDTGCLTGNANYITWVYF